MAAVRFLPCLLAAKSGSTFRLQLLCNLKLIVRFPMELFKTFEGDVKHRKLAWNKKTSKTESGSVWGQAVYSIILQYSHLFVIASNAYH